MELALRTKPYGSRKQYRDTRDKLRQVWSINLQHSRQEYTKEKRQSLQQVLLGKLDIHMLKHSFIQHTKINSRLLNDLNTRHDTKRLLKRISGKAFSDINPSNVFLRSVFQGNGNNQN